MRKSSSYSIDSLFRGLKGLLNSLPSEEEKLELLRDLGEAQNFLEELRLLVEAIPTMESSRELSEGLSRLDILTERAYRDSGLRKLLGLRGPRTDRKRKTVASEDSNGRAIELGAMIAQSPTSEVSNLLTGESVAVLKEVAAHFGIRTLSKERKLDLIKRIATYTENQRGYTLLRGSSSQPA